MTARMHRQAQPSGGPRRPRLRQDSKSSGRMPSMKSRNSETSSSASAAPRRPRGQDDALGVEEVLLGVDRAVEPDGQGYGVGGPGRHGVPLAADQQPDLGVEGPFPQLGDDDALHRAPSSSRMSRMRSWVIGPRCLDPLLGESYRLGLGRADVDGQGSMVPVVSCNKSNGVLLGSSTRTALRCISTMPRRYRRQAPSMAQKSSRAPEPHWISRIARSTRAARSSPPRRARSARVSGPGGGTAGCAGGAAE